MGLKEDVETLLKELADRAPGDITGSAVIRKDGLMVASVLPSEVDERIIGAMGATMMGAADRTCDELNRGTMNQVLIEGNAGKVVFIQAGEKAFLGALVPAQSNLGLVLLELERTSELLKGVM